MVHLVTRMVIMLVKVLTKSTIAQLASSLKNLLKLLTEAKCRSIRTTRKVPLVHLKKYIKIARGPQKLTGLWFSTMKLKCQKRSNQRLPSNLKKMKNKRKIISQIKLSNNPLISLKSSNPTNPTNQAKESSTRLLGASTTSK